MRKHRIIHSNENFYELSCLSRNWSIQMNLLMMIQNGKFCQFAVKWFLEPSYLRKKNLNSKLSPILVHRWLKQFSFVTIASFICGLYDFCLHVWAHVVCICICTLAWASTGLRERHAMLAFRIQTHLHLQQVPNMGVIETVVLFSI